MWFYACIKRHDFGMRKHEEEALKGRIPNVFRIESAKCEAIRVYQASKSHVVLCLHKKIPLDKVICAKTLLRGISCLLIKKKS